MAKGDHERSERRIDEQMKQGQGYLTGVQQQLGNQSAGLSNMYGGGFPQQGNTYGWGSTVPHYSQYGPYFQGNGTDTPWGGSSQQPMTQAGYGQSSGAAANGPSESQMMSILNRYGPANSQNLQRALPEIQKLYPGARPDRSGGPMDELVINGQIYDLINNAEGGGPMSWSFQTGGGGGGGNSIGFNGGQGFGGFSGGGAVGRNLGDYNNIMSRYQGFADTGGFSPQDLANIRSRAVSPIRSVYSTAQQGLERQRALQGGYSPGFSTANARMAREQGQLTSDAATNAEAAIAEMTQRGKLAGMGGMASMYGATPGLANMFGNQMLQSQGQQLTAAGLQNQLSLGLIGGQNNMAQIPGNVGGFIGGMGDFIKNAGQGVGGAIYPWMI